ncbi:large subunit ribosomal protein L3 [Desulfitispora alkaliphila]|uniref:50S ribosomal protein L3 n=1 Tax=Desulfitispora alkaliphila TaxID=622674 RepID=UPI003D200018
MKKAILGKKIGMTQIFDADGQLLPVTVIEAGPCTVVQSKTMENDGYNAIQIGYTAAKENRVTKPMKGHFEKAKIKPLRYLKEVRLEDDNQYEAGQEIKVDVFAEGDKIDITGITRGKGFAGAIKRHGFGRGPMTHGSHYHRGPGSLGALGINKVFKGRKLPGRMGGNQVTVQNLQVVKVDTERNLILVKGAIPGARKSVVMLKESVKA